MAYDPNRDYAKEINAAIASGAPTETVAALNAARNEKIAANQEHYSAKGIGPDDVHGTAAQNYVSGVGTSQLPATAVNPNGVPAANPNATPAAYPSASALGLSPTSSALAQQAAALRNRSLPAADASSLRSYLEQSKDAAIQQANNTIDRAVTTGVNELNRTYEDALESLRTQRNQIDADEARARDNQALRGAAQNGGASGVGNAQLDAISAAAMQNRAAVNAQQTKLKTEIPLKIAELRNKGQHQKADAVLSATQSYLAQIADLEKWAYQMNASAEQFNAQMEQYYLNYLMNLRQMDAANEQWEQEFRYQKEADLRNFNRSVYVDDRNFEYQRGVDQRNFNYQVGRDAVEDDYRERVLNRNMYESDRDFGYKVGRDAVEDDYRERVLNRNMYESDRDFGYKVGRDAVADAIDQRNFDASRDDTKWSQLMQMGQSALQQREYADTRADKERQDALALAESMMNVGYMPDAATMQAAGLDEAYCKMYVDTVKQAQELATQQTLVEMENKQADTIKKLGGTGITADGSNALDALAKAYVQSGTDSPKTWLSNNYKNFGFESKPDEDEFMDAVDKAQTAKEKVLEKDAGPGVKKVSLDMIKREVTRLLDDGTGDAEERLDLVIKQIDLVWPQLNLEQRKDVQKLLSAYGLNYIPD